MFEHLYCRIDDPSKLKTNSPEEISRLQGIYSELPASYLAFLKEVGAGNLGNLVIYAAPIPSAEVYTGAREGALNGIILFGDDMQGFCYGFDLKDRGRVVEIDPRGNTDRTIQGEFTDFLNSFL